VLGGVCGECSVSDAWTAVTGAEEVALWNQYCKHTDLIGLEMGTGETGG
jgi:hypothetical protein